MSQPPMEPGYFTYLLNSNSQQYSSSLNQSNLSTPGSQTQILPRNRILRLERKCHPSMLINNNLRIINTNSKSAFKISRIQEILHRNIFHHSHHNRNFFHHNRQNHNSKYHKPKTPRDGRCKLKKVSKQPIVDLDEDDDNDVIEKRAYPLGSRRRNLASRDLDRTLSKRQYRKRPI
nr:hypothetical protein [Tanacetum cinerariifolium]